MQEGHFIGRRTTRKAEEWLFFQQAETEAAPRLTAAEQNQRRSDESWRKISRQLAAHFRARAGHRPSEDQRQELLTNFHGRCLADPEALTGDRYQLTVWRAVGDTLADAVQAEMIRERDADSIQTWGLLKRDCGLIPTHSRHRTEGQQITWERLCSVTQELADDEERATGPKCCINLRSSRLRDSSLLTATG